MFCKLNSVIYNKFILKKLSLKDNQKPSFIILKHVVFLFNLFMFFIYFILNDAANNLIPNFLHHSNNEKPRKNLVKNMESVINDAMS